MTIDNKAQLKELLKYEKSLYFNNCEKYQKYLKFFKSHPDYFSWKYIKQMRITAYYYQKRKGNPVFSFLYIFHSSKFNVLGRKLGIECGENVFDEGLKIYHTNGIVINGNSKIGKNCRLYGNNCIGNNGISRNCPVIGDNVRICVGAKVLGDVALADNVTIAAGAVVTKSCLEKNVVLAGVPAKIISKNNDYNKFLL